MNEKPWGLITGSSSGIGAETARKLKNQYRLILSGRSQERLQSLAEELGSEHLTMKLDLRHPELEAQIENFFAANGIGALSLLVNNAGIVVRNLFENASLTEVEEQFQVNFFSTVKVTKACLSRLKATGESRIINVASTLGIKPIPETSAYSASKAAMINWSQGLALELADYGIRVNSVSPGMVETPIHDFHGTTDQSLRDQLNALQPLGYMGQPKHIASCVEYLCAKDADWVTGSNLVVDGGISLR